MKDVDRQILCAVLLAACFTWQGCTPALAPPPEAAANCKGVVPPRRVNIYHDLTQSMQGFLAVGKDPPFGSFLESVENAATNSGSKGAPALFQFGTTVEPMPDRDARFRSASYNPRPGYEDNDYRVVINQAAPGDLTVIVTDLYQSDNDVTGVAEAVLSRYFPAATGASGFGVAGVKLPFRGQIFDVGRSRSSFSYTGQRPVYALVLGEKSEVAAYMSALQLELVQNKLDRTLSIELLSRSLVNCFPKIDLPAPPSEAEVHSPSSTSAWLHTSRIDKVDDLVSGPRHSLTKQFRIPSGVDQSDLVLNVPIPLLEFVPPFNVNAIIVSGVPQRLKSGDKPVFEEADEAAEAFKTASVTAQKVDKNDLILRLQATIDSRRLRKDQTYRFIVTAAIDRRKISRPQWVSDWNVSVSQNPDGAKTRNLSSFLSNLWNGMNSTHNPELLRAYFYVRKA